MDQQQPMSFQGQGQGQTYQGQMRGQQSGQQAAFMEDQDLLYTILADLKRTAREYTTAFMESSCPTVRRTFSDLLNSTLSQQTELYRFMENQNMYNASSPALQQEIGKQIQQYKQTLQKTQQYIQQKAGSGQQGYSTH
ncbi:spore coat protein [Paenibacillus gansuensis]|uniref:Spore coat protein n=1 Tax=Paenibacillus gansuensis TaxID=306542 RepID=A0ABW5PIJ4_9BACL